jgi:formylglycine-generating enzyme required for sulfatase activity
MATTLAIGCGSDKAGSTSGTTETVDGDTDSSGDGETGTGTGTDSDGDGFTVEEGDCDDADAATHPGATDSVGDTVDQNCDGTDGVDDDADGFASTDSGGTDCDDTDPMLGGSDLDGDCDGILTESDCDDGDATVGGSDLDGDCDGIPTEEDCDDEDASLGIPDVDDPDCDGVATHAGGGDMILISADSFDMGCTAGQSDCREDESPVMPVTLTHDYYIGETEVTQGEYAALMGSNPSYFSSCGTDCPTENVTWHQAAAYANAVSAASGLTECYTCSGDDVECEVAVSDYACDGYRLPTEAEWEGAARCGEDTLYAGTDTRADGAWSAEDSDDSTQPVAGKDPNACGLYDMSGNVFEWNQDWYDSEYYTSDGRTDPEGPSSSFTRVFRGGGWNHSASYQRVAMRSFLDPSIPSWTIGFRLARTIL